MATTEAPARETPGERITRWLADERRTSIWLANESGVSRERLRRLRIHGSTLYFSEAIKLAKVFGQTLEEFADGLVLEDDE